MSEHRTIEILLVEDNATDAELCIRALGKRNLANHLTWVKDGAEALDLLFRRGPYSALEADGSPKLVLLDLLLPKVDGLELLAHVKADPILKLLPVVVLTSSREDSDLKRAWELGANSYIQKPVQFDEFARVVAELGLYWLVTNKPADVPWP